jgi:hypothetical protein
MPDGEFDFDEAADSGAVTVEADGRRLHFEKSEITFLTLVSLPEIRETHAIHALSVSLESKSRQRGLSASGVAGLRER